MALAKTLLRVPAVNGTVTRSPNFLGFSHHLGITTDVPTCQQFIHLVLKLK